MVRFVECGAGDIVTKLVIKNLPNDALVQAISVAPRGKSLRDGIEDQLRALGLEKRVPPKQATAKTPETPEAKGEVKGVVRTSVRREVAPVPIGIVGIGCVLPGADNPDQYWQNIKKGISGIVDLAALDPDAGRDFMAGSVDGQLKIVSDKTYTLLNGSVLNIHFDEAAIRGAITTEEFDLLTRGQKLLALALGQALSSNAGRGLPESRHVQCILGSTADGSGEFDDAAFVESIQDELPNLGESNEVCTCFARVVEQVHGRGRGDAHKLSQQRAYQRVLDQFVPGASTYVVDTACSSSLYAVNLGIKALLREESQLVLAGGVFAPGPANNPLFAQFRGLSSTGSRPFDKNADGVIFGDGAAILVLKRLPDALADGDRVIAVIRGMGLSSDGKSPSINVPQSKGQSLAVRRALSQSGIEPNTVQYVEAHATATPVGDKVEIASLGAVFGDRPTDLPRIELGSVKALIGHTGWVSGAASIIKLCKAFEARTIPRQFNYSTPDPAIGLDQSRFAISTAEHPWPQNIDGNPRRAGVNGFGFGGTNAHLLLEEFDESYHRQLCEAVRKPHQSQRVSVVVVGIGPLFPSSKSLAADQPEGQRKFGRSGFPLPAKKMLLPDVTEHMDASQFLASLAAEKILKHLPESWTHIREEIGVVLGLESKTEAGVAINERVFLDRLHRLFRERFTPIAGLTQMDADRVLEKLSTRIRRACRASGPYTLPGLMPNVAASRISNLYDLNGPNIVVDKDDGSLFQSIVIAERLLAQKDCKMVLAGGISASNGSDRALAEAALLLALTTEATAREHGFPILGTLALNPDESQLKDAQEIKSAADLDYRGAAGAVEILAALNQAAIHGGTAVVKERVHGTTRPITLLVGRKHLGRHESLARTAPANLSKTYAYVQGTQIHRYAPALYPQAAREPALAIPERKILFLTTQSEEFLLLRRSGMLDALTYRVASPASLASATDIAIDLSSEERLVPSLAVMKTIEYDTVMALQFLDGKGASTLLHQGMERERGLLELLFAVCRNDYSRIGDGRMPIVSLSVNGFAGGTLHPCTGLTGGFLKSLTRELPRARVAIVNTDETNFLKALGQVERETAQEQSDGEVCYVDGQRHVFRLYPLADLARDDHAYLSRDSVVLATGGGRGVTAVLAEELLDRFGCTVVAAGRTDPDSLPEHLAVMDESVLQAYETKFYESELARDGKQSIRELKRKFISYQAAHEVGRTIRHLRSLPGRFEYQSLDLSEQSSVDQLVETIYRQYGRIDLILHGAGIQISGMLTKKSLSDFRLILAAKLASLGYVYAAVERNRKGRPVHYHLLTSAFSYMGNDGQSDYGAANETLNRIAAAMNDPVGGTHWSTMGWLGWAGIGMTRGSEFAALAASRRLRGITKEEGQKIFSEIMRGTPSSPINILLADGEIAHYGVALADAVPCSPVVTSMSRREETYPWNLTLENAPFLQDHLVRGIPTLPAAFLTCVVAESAKRLRPKLNIAAYEDTHYHRFVRVPHDIGAKLRVHARVLSETADEARIQVRVLSDFVHRSGTTLQRDILHTEAIIRMSQSLPAPPPRAPRTDRIEGRRLPDPYLIPGSGVQLGGLFDSTREIRVGATRRIASYKLADHRYQETQYSYLVPNMICVDAFWRFGTVQSLGDGMLGVYVPEKCDVMRVYFDYVAFNSPELTKTLTFRGTNPRSDGDLLHVGPIDVSDSHGNLMLVVEQGVCRKFGEVKSSIQRITGSEVLDVAI